VDNRLQRLIKEGQRAAKPITDHDLAEIARGVTAAVRGTAKARVVLRKGESYVRIKGTGINTVIFKSDWERILPFLTDDTFNTQRFPVETGPQPYNPVTRYLASQVDLKDPLYNRVFHILRTLYPTTFPTAI